MGLFEVRNIFDGLKYLGGKKMTIWMEKSKIENKKSENVGVDIEE